MESAGAGPATLVPAPFPGTLRYDDLGATVHGQDPPPALAAELPALYSSLFATMDWFLTHDDPGPLGAVVLDEPRQVVFFDRDGPRSARVLNKDFPIPPPAARRVCLALFRALPEVRRLRLEVRFEPRALGLPHREDFATDHLVVSLPADLDAYHRSLGRSTRRNLRLYANRVARDLPRLATTVERPGRRSRELVDLFIAWKKARFGGQGRRTYWERSPDLAERFVRLLARCGEAHVTRLDGEPVALSFAFPVGDAVCAQETAFHPDYERYRLGFLAHYWVVCDALRRGAREVDFLWGTTTYKERLGALPRTAHSLSVFRHPVDRLWTLDEDAQRLRRRTAEALRRRYWDARHRAGELVRGRRGGGDGARPPEAG